LRINNIAVFVSGGGTNLQALLDGIESGQIRVHICLVISGRKDAYAIERAKAKGIPVKVVCRGDYPTREAFDEANLQALKGSCAEGVVLAGYLSILGRNIIEEYRDRIINIHPALIPSFCGKGYYGIHVHEAALSYGVKVTGATVHFVDEGTYTGPIIFQEAVPVMAGDTPETLQQRVMKTEHVLIRKAVALFAAGKLKVNGRNVTIENEGE
jgi:phosphoribosylglycinamide formyltransferase-1